MIRCMRNRCIYSFFVKGLVYHYMNELVPLDKQSINLQLYFYDIEYEVDNCLCCLLAMSLYMVEKLMKILLVNLYP